MASDEQDPARHVEGKKCKEASQQGVTNGLVHTIYNVVCKLSPPSLSRNIDVHLTLSFPVPGTHTADDWMSLLD
jgi:hypothetical protein